MDPAPDACPLARRVHCRGPVLTDAPFPVRALDIEVDQVEGMYFVDAPTLHAVVTERSSTCWSGPCHLCPLRALHRTISGATRGGYIAGWSPPSVAPCKVQVTQQRPLAQGMDARHCPVFGRNGRTHGPVGTLHRRCTCLARPHHGLQPSLPFPCSGKMDTSPFWDQLIDQIEVQENGAVSFRPRIGDVVVELGPAAQLEQDLNGRLDRLLNFYKALIQRGDLRQYRKISLQYDGQLVASK